MDAEGLGGPGVDRALGEPQGASQDDVLLQGGPRDVICCHLSVPPPSGLGSLSSPISTENASTPCRVVVLGLLWLGPFFPGHELFLVPSACLIGLCARPLWVARATYCPSTIVVVQLV